MTESTKQKSTPRKGRVFWTEKELQAVTDAAVLISIQDTEHIWFHLAKAQSEVLPSNRQRRIGGKHVVNDEILRRFTRAREELLSHRESMEPAEVKVEVPTPPAEPVSTPAPVVDRDAVIASLSIAEIFGLLADRLGPFVESIKALAGVAAHVGKPGQQSVHPKPSPPPADTQTLAPVPVPTPQPAASAAKPNPATQKAKVVVLFGFDVGQELEIKQKAERFHMELVFLSQPTGAPVPTIPVCDWAIVNRKTPLTRRATTALRNRPGTECTVDANKVDTALQKLSDFNSRPKRV